MVHRYALAARAAEKPVWLIRTGQAPGPGMAHRCALAYHGARARYGSYVRVGARAATPGGVLIARRWRPGRGPRRTKKGGAFAPPRFLGIQPVSILWYVAFLVRTLRYTFYPLSDRAERLPVTNRRTVFIEFL